MFHLDDTIAAIASASGGAARGIVRISGPAAIQLVEQTFRCDDAAVDLKSLHDPTAIQGQVEIPASPLVSGPLSLPVDVFLWPTARSYTRQPLAELHTIGSPPLLNAVLEHCCSAGARLARPGEFTLRAFLAGRIDLPQAEAVLGVVDAADRRQLEAALEQLAGGLSRPLNELRDDLLNLLADLEAGLDFAEEDIRFVSTAELQRRLSAPLAQLQTLTARLTSRGDTVSLPRVPLIGAPNVGKSSLFNALAKDSAALVSTQPGTTRDYLTAQLDVDGLKVELIDTAGVDSRSSEKPVDAAAQAAAAGQHRRADLRLLCIDGTQPLNDWARSELDLENTLLIRTKCDLPGQIDWNRSAIDTSSVSGAGLDCLRTAVHDALVSQAARGEFVAGTAGRIQNSVRLATEGIGRACQLAATEAGEELLAAELRLALDELGKIVGAIYTDDLLDRIFSRFCIGK